MSFQVGEKVSLKGRRGIGVVVMSVPGGYYNGQPLRPNYVVAWPNGNTATYNEEALQFEAPKRLDLPDQVFKELLLSPAPGDYPNVKELFFLEPPKGRSEQVRQLSPQKRFHLMINKRFARPRILIKK